MTQLEKLSLLLGSQPDENPLLEVLLEIAREIICDIRFTTDVEPIYTMTQVRMAIELYNKRGVEGQTSHGENGISRSYERSDISDSLISQITPYVRTPLSIRRVVL